MKNIGIHDVSEWRKHELLQPFQKNDKIGAYLKRGTCKSVGLNFPKDIEREMFTDAFFINGHIQKVVLKVLPSKVMIKSEGVNTISENA